MTIHRGNLVNDHSWGVILLLEEHYNKAMLHYKKAQVGCSGKLVMKGTPHIPPQSKDYEVHMAPK